MSGFSWVSVVSIFCYLFLLSSFVSVRKPRKKIISAFMLMLLIMILWNGGSLCMRLQLFGLVDFWHHVSLLGIMMVPAGYFHFTTSFLDVRNSRGTYIWFICFLGIFVANCITNFFVPLPDVVVQNGQTEFLYHYDWEIYLLLVFIVASVVHLAVVAWRHCRGNKIAFQQLLPVLIGLLIMTLGHVIAFLPAFVGFPVDMLSGVINAFFLFYALYKKKLFRMSILLSKYSYAILSLLLGIIIFSNCGLPVIDWLINTVGFNEVGAQITVYFALAGIIVVIFIIIKIFKFAFLTIYY